MGDEPGPGSPHQAMPSKCHACHEEAPFPNLHKDVLGASTALTLTHDCSGLEEMGSQTGEHAPTGLVEPSAPPGSCLCAPSSDQGRDPDDPPPEPQPLLVSPTTACFSVSPTSF